MKVADVLAPLRTGYPELLARLQERSEWDDRVRALWIHGSTVKGLADRDSDLDVMITVADGAASHFGAGLADWMTEVAQPVFTKLLMGRVLVFLTADVLRLDVMVEEVGELPRAGDRHRLLLFERESVSHLLPPPAEPRVADAQLVEVLVKDFIGELAMMTGVVNRQDWLFGLESVQRSRAMLHQLLVEGNLPLPPHGTKQWSAQLTAPQRELFANLPGVTATRASILAAKWATVEAFYATVPTLAADLGVAWPHELESAIGGFLRRELGYTLPVEGTAERSTRGSRPRRGGGR